MTVKQLKEALSKYPDNMDVFVAERQTEFTYGLINSVRSEDIDFYDYLGDKKPLARDKVVIIDEE